MFDKLLFFLQVICVDKATINLDKPREFVIFINKDQLNIISDNLDEDEMREVLTKYLKSLIFLETKKEYKLTFYV